MTTRFKSGMVLLMAFLVFGASAQASVCDLMCALHSDSCHAAAGAMDMSHCAGSLPASGAAVSIASSHDGSCSHPFVLALQSDVGAGVDPVDIRWAVVEVLPVPTVLPKRDGASSTSPPLRPGATSSLTTLRV
jgi:hypothetical protein